MIDAKYNLNCLFSWYIRMTRLSQTYALVTDTSLLRASSNTFRIQFPFKISCTRISNWMNTSIIVWALKQKCSV